MYNTQNSEFKVLREFYECEQTDLHASHTSSFECQPLDKSMTNTHKNTVESMTSTPLTQMSSMNRLLS